jgi:hypothetical protein
MRMPRPAAVALLPLVCTSIGCNILGPAAYYLGPRRIQKAEFMLTEGRLAVVIEAAHPEQDNPVFNQALFDKLAEILRERKVPSELVPYRDLLELRQAGRRDFGKWSLQRIGRELRATQVLYLRIEKLQLRQTPDHPLVTPEVSLRYKVIGVREPSAHARLWPKEAEGRQVSRTRPAQEATDARLIDGEARKLAHDTAYLIAEPFTDVDLEERPPTEP